MALTRKLDSPLLSEDEALRQAALLQLTRMPSPEGAKQIIEALLHFLKVRPSVAEEFEHLLWEQPLGPLAEAPLLHLLDEDDDAVREEAAFILFKLRIRSSSKARLAQALALDRSPWVRAHAAKALAMLPGSECGARIAEAIDNEATLEAIARMGEALALTGEAAHASVLRDQAEQLREREAPVDAVQPEVWVRTAGQLALFLDALAAKLAGEAPEGARLEDHGRAWQYVDPDHGAIRVGGGLEFGGYTARVVRGDSEEKIELDSPDARKTWEQLTW